MAKAAKRSTAKGGARKGGGRKPAARKAAVRPAAAPRAVAPAASGVAPAASAVAPAGAPQYFEFRSKDSNKFWEVSVEGVQVTVRYGKIGTAGQVTVKALGTADEAVDHALKVVGEKTKKGYVKTRRPAV